MFKTVGASAVMAVCVLLASTLSAQLPPLSPAHLNPAIARLAREADLRRVDTGSVTRECPYARPPRHRFHLHRHGALAAEPGCPRELRGGDERQSLDRQERSTAEVGGDRAHAGLCFGKCRWEVKQALDIGVMGFVFNTVETREQAEAAVKSMRYPPWKAFPNTRKGPEGIRGWSPGGAVWAGASIRKSTGGARSRPLNPDGDLMAIMIIETAEGSRMSTPLRRCRA